MKIGSATTLPDGGVDMDEAMFITTHQVGGVAQDMALPTIAAVPMDPLTTTTAGMDIVMALPFIITMVGVDPVNGA